MDWRRARRAHAVNAQYERHKCERRAAGPAVIAPLTCLSVRQPWADLIVQGEKCVENRSWPTRYRGILLIHASRTIEDTPEVRNYIADQRGRWPIGCERRVGAVIGAVLLCDCVDVARMPREARWAVGRYCWLMRGAVAFAQPVQMAGKQGLFPVDARHFNETQTGQIFSVGVR